jgi:hypothetical protein
MNLKNQPPAFVPVEYVRELDKLSKAALMDLVWDFATRCHGHEDDPQGIMIELRRSAEIVLEHRMQARDAWRLGEDRA